MKRVFLCFLILSLLLGLSGCAGKKGAAAEGSAGEPETVDAASPLLAFEETPGLYRSLSQPLAAGDFVYTVLGESDGAQYTGQNGALYRVPLLGGEPEDLGRLLEDLDAALSAAGPDGSLWFWGRSAPSLTRLDSQGRVSAVYDLSALSLPDCQEFFIGEGDIAYLSCFGAGQSLAAVELDGNAPRLLWQKTLDDSFVQGLYSFALCADGSPAALAETETGSVLTVFDRSTGEPRLEQDLSGAVYDRLLSGAGDAPLFLRAGGRVFRLEPETGSVTEALDLSLAGLWPHAPLTPLPDGSFAALDSEGDSAAALLRIVRSPLPDGGAVLTLALTGGENDLLQGLVQNWNRMHDAVKLRLTDYSLYATQAKPEGGSLRLLADLSAGAAPDLYELSGLPAAFSAKDRFEDLYPWLEADGALDRSALRENVLRAGEAGGRLRQLIPRFVLVTAGAGSAFVGERQGLSPADYQAVLAANPSLEQLFPQTYSRADLLELLTCANFGSLVDLEQGQARFDGALFRELLSLCARQPAEPSETYRPAEMLAQGRQLLDLNVYASLSLEGIENSLDRLGPDFRFPGLPCDTGCGSAVRPVLSLAMSSSSPHKEQAWQFLRQFLTGEAEPNQGDGSFSLLRQQDLERRDRLLESAKEASARDSAALSAGLDRLLALAEQADRLYGVDRSLLNLVRELAEPYFAGDKSLEDAVSDIQSRANIYLAEQLG